MRSSVDLPQPEGPTITMNSPSLMSAGASLVTWLLAMKVSPALTIVA